MHQVNLNEHLFQEVQRRAAQAGFSSVDDYVADVLRHDLHEQVENLDHLFTPERLAHIDRADTQIDAGQGIPAEQVREHFSKKRSG